MNKLIIGNWKQNPKTWTEAKELLNTTFEIFKKNKDFKNQIYLAVPSIFFGNVINVVEKENEILNKGFFKKLKQVFVNKKEVITGVQDVFWAEEGAFTGKFGAEQAKSVGAKFSMIGHSETRESENNKKGYTNEEINLKIHNLLQNKVTVILCIGEKQRDLNSDWKQEIGEQMKKNLGGVNKEDLKDIVIAYEPIWAIGKNAVRVASNEEIQETIDFIRFYLENHFGSGAGDLKVIYGGSVDEKNVKEMLSLKNIDGVLVGRASTDTTKWQKLLENTV
jgi:triosephosphate isomerase (TIM)